MKIPALGILGLLAATSALAADRQAPRPEQRDEGEQGQTAAMSTQQERNCEATVQMVREERGLPLLQRGDNADAVEPVLFKALDHEIDGCDVLLVGDGDIRPVPAPNEDGPLLHPAQ